MSTKKKNAGENSTRNPHKPESQVFLVGVVKCIISSQVQVLDFDSFGAGGSRDVTYSTPCLGTCSIIARPPPTI